MNGEEHLFRLRDGDGMDVLTLKCELGKLSLRFMVSTISDADTDSYKEFKEALPCLSYGNDDVPFIIGLVFSSTQQCFTLYSRQWNVEPLQSLSIDGLPSRFEESKTMTTIISYSAASSSSSLHSLLFYPWILQPQEIIRARKLPHFSSFGMFSIFNAVILIHHSQCIIIHFTTGDGDII